MSIGLFSNFNEIFSYANYQFNIRITLTFFYASSQDFAVANSMLNIAYVDMPNYLDIAVEGYSCKKVSLKTDNGKIEKNGCDYLFYPSKMGDAKIDIMVKSRIIGSTYFRIKNLPPPTIDISGKRGGKISRADLSVQIGLSAYIYDVLNCSPRASVDSLTVIAMRQDSLLFIRKNIGARFDVSLKAMFASLQTSDKVFFLNIYCSFLNRATMQAIPTEFEIE